MYTDTVFQQWNVTNALNSQNTHVFMYLVSSSIGTSTYVKGALVTFYSKYNKMYLKRCEMAHSHFVIPHKSRLPEEGNTMVSVFVCQTGCPGSNPEWSVCFRKLNILKACYWFVQTGPLRPCHVLLWLYDNAYKRSIVTFVKVGHWVSLAGFCLFFYSTHVWMGNLSVSLCFIVYQHLVTGWV